MNQCVFIRGFRAKRTPSQIIPIRIGSDRVDKNPQQSPYRDPTLQTNDSLRSTLSFLDDDSPIEGSSSNLDTIGPPVNHENLQHLPYPSSTTLPSNGGPCNISFMTSPSCDSFIEVTNDIAKVRLPGHDCSL